tara:strand:- start:96 stop:878 length:783 start_codon:yes stop_codon:yes gene_type:complete
LAETWHYGLVARWWSEFNLDGPEISYFKKVIQQAGVPALDVGCGTGRILIPCLEAGIEVHGTDISSEMIDYCQTKLDSKNLNTKLYVSPTHELDLDCEYKTIISCGVFGVGTTPEEDLEGLKRLKKHLISGGKYIFDFYLPDKSSKEWEGSEEHQPNLPSKWSKPDHRDLSDGTCLTLQTRILELNSIERYYIREIRIEHHKDKVLIGTEQRQIRLNIYVKNEVELMLQSVFTEVKIFAGLSDREPIPNKDYYLIVEASL